MHGAILLIACVYASIVDTSMPATTIVIAIGDSMLLRGMNCQIDTYKQMHAAREGERERAVRPTCLLHVMASPRNF